MRHAKNCQLVQLNWKPSASSWELHYENELKDIMEKVDELFKNQFQLNIFKKNTHSSLLKQAEIDALKLQGQYLTGMDLFQNKVSIIALEMEYYYGPNWRDDPNRVDEWMALGKNAYVDWFEDQNGMQHILKNAETNPVTRLDDALSALGHL